MNRYRIGLFMVLGCAGIILAPVMGVVIDPSLRNTFDGQYLSPPGYGWVDGGGINNSYYKITTSGGDQDHRVEFHLKNDFTTNTTYGILVQGSHVTISGVDLSTTSGADQRPVHTITQIYEPPSALMAESDSGYGPIVVNNNVHDVKLVNVHGVSTRFPGVFVDSSDVSIIGTNNPDPYLTSYSGGALNDTWGSNLTSYSLSSYGMGLMQQTTTRSSSVSVLGDGGTGMNITGPLSGVELNGNTAIFTGTGSGIHINGTGAESGPGSDRNSGITAWSGSQVTITASDSSIKGQEYGGYSQGGAKIAITCPSCEIDPIHGSAYARALSDSSQGTGTSVVGGIHGLFLTGPSGLPGSGNITIENVSVRGVTGNGIELSGASGYTIRVTSPSGISGGTGKFGATGSSSSAIQSGESVLRIDTSGPYLVNITPDTIPGPDPCYLNILNETGSVVYTITDWNNPPAGVTWNPVTRIVSFTSPAIEVFSAEKLPVPVPLAITSIYPSSGVNTGPVTITSLSGTTFRNGLIVNLTRTGYTTITGTDVVLVNSTFATCILPVTGAAPGTWNVTVTNTDEESAILLNGFTITAPSAPPTILHLTPSEAQNTSPVTISNLSGSNLQNGLIVNLTRTGYTTITGTDVVLVNSTFATCILPVTGAATGAWNVTVTNTDGNSATLLNGFTITAPSAPPTILHLTPSEAQNTSPVKITNLSGSNLQNGLIVNLTRTGYNTITGTGVMVVNSTFATCTLPVTGAVTGPWNVTVKNPGDQSGILVNGFTITALTPAPTIMHLTPSAAMNTGPVHITNLTGENLQAGLIVNLTRTGYTNITATGVSVVNSTYATCTLPISGAAPGPWNVTGTNPGGQTGIRTNAFTITSSGNAIRIGVWRSPTWNLDTSGDGAYGTDDVKYTLGANGDRPVTGDWNGNGRTEIGVWRPATRQWFLDWSGNGAYGTGDVTYTLGAGGDIPVTGDWNGNGNGRAEIGVWRPATRQWFLDWSGNGAYGTGDVTYTLGAGGDKPVTGDWNGNGRTEIGVWRPTSRQWFLDWSGNGAYGTGDVTYTLGASGDRPVTGDWDGNGRTNIGVWRPATRQWFLDWSGNGAYGTGDVTYTLGSDGDTPVTGDWPGTGSGSVESVILPDEGTTSPVIHTPAVSRPVTALPRVEMPVKDNTAIHPVIPGGSSGGINPLSGGISSQTSVLGL